MRKIHKIYAPRGHRLHGEFTIPKILEEVDLATTPLGVFRWKRLSGGRPGQNAGQWLLRFDESETRMSVASFTIAEIRAWEEAGCPDDE